MNKPAKARGFCFSERACSLAAPLCAVERAFENVSLACASAHVVYLARQTIPWEKAIPAWERDGYHQAGQMCVGSILFFRVSFAHRIRCARALLILL